METLNRVHVEFDGYGGIWKTIERGDAEATGYHAHILECVTELRASGITYNSEVGPRAAAMMAERFAYPALLPDRQADFGLQSREFGSHCYMAGNVYRAREQRARDKAAVASLTIGQKFARLRFTDGGTVTSAVVLRFTHTGSEVEMQGKRGASVVTFKCGAAALLGLEASAKRRADALKSRRA